MRKYFFLFLIIISCNCNNQSILDFFNSPEGRKIAVFEEADKIYFPTSEAFEELRPLTNKHNIDVLDKLNFNQFLKYFTEKKLNYSQFILIESYESGEKINLRKSLVIDCKGKQSVISFSNVLGPWKVKSITSNSEYLFNKVEEIFSLATGNSVHGRFLVVSYVKCDKVERIGIVPSISAKFLNQYF